MSTGKRILDSYFIQSGSLAADYTSSTINILYLDNIGIQLVWTGTPTGTFIIQVSNDNTTWGTLSPTSPSTISAGGSASDAEISLNQLPWKYLRVKYTRSSGTGTLQGYITGKEV